MGWEYESLGTFEIVTGEVVVSDPCYKLGTWCQGIVEKVRNGTWEAFTTKGKFGGWGERCAELLVLYEGFKPGRDSFKWEELPFEVGVDSGQAGVFDRNHYRNDSDAKGWKFKRAEGPLCGDDAWYDICCDVTLVDQAGVIPYGAVSTSGCGDGGYTAYAAKGMSGMVVGIKIVFLTEDDLVDCNDEGDDEKTEETQDGDG